MRETPRSFSLANSPKAHAGPVAPRREKWREVPKPGASTPIFGGGAVPSGRLGVVDPEVAVLGADLVDLFIELGLVHFAVGGLLLDPAVGLGLAIVGVLAQLLGDLPSEF